MVSVGLAGMLSLKSARPIHNSKVRFPLTYSEITVDPM